ncbi:MAG: hypothetical protein C4582_06600 [Desulfobacteraceae bacterium]|jgi:hypothetical protein|nr:MAG: hypothetical protein C4582_06600 [Desulfobacteraceae bacterium]
MKINTDAGLILDTDRDFTAAERHILQKLFLWESMAESIEQFRQKKNEAMLKGWNSSGPVPVSGALSAVTADMEKRVARRLKEGDATKK